tara:strand:+ start:47 stop:580 length:534 start_codon:yes stop_codon:yes gene_type:complete
MEITKIKSDTGAQLLYDVNSGRGLLWEKIELLNHVLISEVEGYVTHTAGTKQSPEMENTFPLKQHLENGLYTRELFMPKGSLIVSMIHKQNHPSFLLKGKVSFIADNGTLKHVEGPFTIFTKAGTQRVLYIHEDTNWCCVYKTDAKNFEEAEADVYTNNYRELPIELINKNKLLCQD